MLMIRKLLNNLWRPFTDPSKETTETVEAASKRSHQLFIDFVEKQRGSKLKVGKDKRSESIYDARVFEGEEAQNLGLVDEVGNLSGVLATTYPDCKVKVVDEPEYAKRLRQLKQWM